MTNAHQKRKMAMPEWQYCDVATARLSSNALCLILLVMVHVCKVRNRWKQVRLVPPSHAHLEANGSALCCRIETGRAEYQHQLWPLSLPSCCSTPFNLRLLPYAFHVLIKFRRELRHAEWRNEVLCWSIKLDLYTQACLVKRVLLLPSMLLPSTVAWYSGCCRSSCSCFPAVVSISSFFTSCGAGEVDCWVAGWMGCGVDKGQLRDLNRCYYLCHLCIHLVTYLSYLCWECRACSVIG